MKTIQFTLLALVAGMTSLVAAQPTAKAYLKTNSGLLEASIPTATENIITVPEAQASSINLVSAADVITPPVGTTSMKFTSVNVTIEYVSNGGAPTKKLNNLSLLNSSWNVESSTSKPHVFARGSSGVINVTGTLGANTVSSPTSILFTDYQLSMNGVVLPQLVKTGDYLKRTLTMSFDWTDAEGAHSSSAPLVSEIMLQIIGNPVLVKYATPVVVIGGDNRLYITIVCLDKNEGIRWSEYAIKWFILRSVDLMTWIPEPNASFITEGPNYVVVAIPKDSAKMFFRVGNH